jgi:hypothetical protein
MIGTIVRGWNAMSPVRKVRRVISIGLIGFAIWALSPYLYSRQVDEPFPAAAPVPTAAMADAGAMAKPTAAMADAGAMAKPTAAMADAGAMSDAKPTAAMADAGAMAKPTAAMADAGAMAEPTAMAATEPVALVAGSLVPGSTPGDRASGSATIYRLTDASHVLRLEEFATTNGPDLFVVLSRNANPDADGIGDKGSYVQLEALKGNTGSQNYTLPADLDPSGYKSVVIWCRAFNIVFGYATLEPKA